MVLVKRKLLAGRRAFVTLASQSIGNDLLKGLVEIITNGDDSYYRLESKGIPGSGKIEIEIDRRPKSKQTLIRIRDFAEGIDNQRMDECVGYYGENVSGDTGRGFFGMGLKDTIINFGEGEIKSIKDAKYYRCKLKADDFTLYNPTTADKRIRKELSIPNNGTVVEILVTNPRVRIPYFENLREDLQNHILLRLIMSDTHRTIVLRDLRSGNESTLFYQEPEIDAILFDKVVPIPEFPNAQIQFTVKKAKGSFPLSQEGSCRTGGILITTRRTVHEATLFEYDSDPFAANLFGELRCEYIYELQHSSEPVVDRNRDGLMRNHPFTKCLVREAKKILKTIVEEEKEKEKQRERELENENTRKRFQEAVKELNKIATLELEKLSGPGTGGTGHCTAPL
ncbi:MAG TPA: hypothetical protein VNL73_03650 [Verrucomicrobiae bacterium]|nr:hypothetical protein [Verrucomicrobiae bacterium]